MQAAETCDQREERRKFVLNEEKKIDFFPQCKPQQGVIGKKEEEEREEEEVPILDDRDVETEGLIREYQRNAKPTQSTIRLLEFYGGEDWRKNKGAGMKKCIQRLVEEKKKSRK